MSNISHNLPYYNAFMPLLASGYCQSVFGGYLRELQEIIKSPSFQQKCFVIFSQSFGNALQTWPQSKGAADNNPMVVFGDFAQGLHTALLDALLEEIALAHKEAGYAYVLNLQFVVRFFMDSCAPKNLPFLRSKYWENVASSNGFSVFKGLENFWQDALQNDGMVSVVDKKAFAIGKNVAYTSGSVVWQNELVQLIRYKPRTAKTYAIPLFIAPPFINKYYILDLNEKNSAIRWLVDKGYDVFLISWRNADHSMAELAISDYVLRGIGSALEATVALSKSSKVNMLGYCIGGTFLMMLLGYLAQKKTHMKLVNTVTLLNSLLDFSFPGVSGIFINEDLANFIQNHMPLVAGSAMANFFSCLRPAELIWNYATNRYGFGESLPNSDVMYWNSDSPNLPGKLFSEYLKTCYLSNSMAAPNRMKIGDRPIDLGVIDKPFYCVSALKDHITPCEAIFRSANLLKECIFTIVESGHVMSVVGIPGFKQYDYYTGRVTKDTQKVNNLDLQTWMSSAEHVIKRGCWWDNWHEWQRGLSGEMTNRVEAAEIEPAPGSYAQGLASDYKKSNAKR